MHIFPKSPTVVYIRLRSDEQFRYRPPRSLRTWVITHIVVNPGRFRLMGTPKLGILPLRRVAVSSQTDHIGLSPEHMRLPQPIRVELDQQLAAVVARSNRSQ